MPATELFTPMATRETVDNGPDGTVLVIGERDEIGRRVVERLVVRGLPVRVGSRAAAPPFDWDDQATWGPALCGADSVYFEWTAALAVSGAVEKVCLFAALAVELGVRRLVLLSGHGEEARCAEEVVRGASAEWTILRSNRLDQGVGMSYVRDAVPGDEIVLPADDATELFVDADDVADSVVAALTEDGHVGRLYELTGLRPSSRC